MAYQYDEMGNVVGEYESDEERRRRLATEAAQQPVKQTITYNPDGTSEVTIKGTPEALSPMNPNMPTISGPVAPSDTFRRMQQVESGGRDYNAQGQPLTSPAGAMFRNQVMPATAAAPGYGIRPAQAQTPEEYNRVGQEYYQAMLRKFGGDQQAAAAAYNAGPGRVQQNMQANAGRMNVQQLPRETQGYLQKIGQAVGNMIPSAQAGTVPTPMPQGQNARDDLMTRGAMPTAVRPQPDSVINNQVAQYEARQAPQLNLPPDPFQQYINLQDNPRDLINYGYDTSVPKALQDRARDRAAELITQERSAAAAREQIPTMSESDIARVLRDKTTGGSYLKAALFGILGMENSAQAEAAKLGIGRETMTQINGQPAMVKMAANGTPIEGYNAVTGKKLTAEELVAAAQFGTIAKGTEAEAGTYLDPTGRVPGNWVLERRPGGSVFRQVGTGAVATAEQANALRKTGVQGTLSDQRARQVQEINLKLQGKGVEEQMRILSDYNKQLAANGFAIVQPSEVGITVPQIGAAGAGATTAPVAPGATTAPGTAGGAPSAERPTAAQFKGREEVVKKAADVVAGADKIVTELVNVERAATDAITKKNNFGTILSGTIPGEQTIGRVLKTQDYINTQNVLDVVNKQAAVNAKMLGTNPTDRDLQFVTATKPDETWPADAVADWLRKSADATRRTLDFARKQMESGGTYIPPTPQPSADQFRIISVTPGPR